MVRPHARRVVAFALAATMGLGVVGSTRSASAEVIEQVVAVVNDEAIFLSELRRRMMPFLAQIFQAPTETERLAALHELRTRLLDHLIDEELIKQAAREMSVRVSAADVDRAVANVRRQNGLSAEQFWQAVRQQGFTEAQYRTDLRRQLLRLKVLNNRVRSRVNITEDDVRRVYDQQVARGNRSLQFAASHVFFALPAGASAVDVANIRQQAEAVSGQVTAATFAAAIAQHGGGNLGTLTQGSLPANLEAVLMRLAVDQVSDPVRGDNGFHVFLLHNRQTGSAGLPEFDEVKNDLYREMMERAMSRQEALFLEELRREAIVERRID